MLSPLWWQWLALKIYLCDLSTQQLMKRTRNEEFNEDVHQKANKRVKIDESLRKNTDADLTLPKDVWLEVLEYLHMYDIIFLRAVNSSFYKWCKELKSFPKYFVLDQDKCMEYLVENGFTSLLDYVKNTLHFEWMEKLPFIAARAGQVDTFKFLREHSNPTLDLSTALYECTKGTCDYSMVKYLHESGALWQGPKSGPVTTMDYIANHGHLDCMAYAMINGSLDEDIGYTPSTECLDLAIQHKLGWKERTLPGKRNICEEAAYMGDLTMLQYAHQLGAPLHNSASIAATAGHLECLKYALKMRRDNTPIQLSTGIKTLACFSYIYEHSAESIKSPNQWVSQFVVGDIEILQFMLKNGFSLPSRDWLAYLTATTANSVVLFKFLLNDLQLYDTSTPYMYYPFLEGDFDGLKIAIERKLLYLAPFGFGSDAQHLLASALMSKKAKVVELILDSLLPNHFKTGSEIPCLAITMQETSPEVLDLLTKRGFKLTSAPLAAVTAKGNLPNLAYLTRSGCQWGDTACSTTHPLCVKYAKEHGCTKFV